MDQLVDSPHPPTAAHSLFPSVSIANRSLFDNPFVARQKISSAYEKDNTYSLPNSSTVAEPDADTPCQIPANNQDRLHFNDSAASFGSVKQCVGDLNTNDHIHKEYAKDAVDSDRGVSREIVKCEDTRVNADTANEHPFVCPDSHSSRIMSSFPGEANRITNVIDSDECETDGNCFPPVPYVLKSDTRVAKKGEDSGVRPAKSAVLPKKERAHTSRCSTAADAALTAITNGFSLKREPRCKTCQSRIDVCVRHVSSSLCQSCFFIEQLRSVDGLSPASTPARDASEKGGPSIEEQPRSDGDDSSALFRVDSLSSLDLPPPDYDDATSHVSSSSGPIIVDEINPSPNVLSAPSPRRIRLCRVCDSGTAGVVSGHIKLWVCGSCSHAPLPRKPNISNVGRTAVNKPLLDDEHLAKFARRRRLSAPLHDDEVFMEYVQRKKRRKRC